MVSPPTIWYMGAKTRLLESDLDTVIARHVPKGGSVLDLFTGTAAVAARCARRYRTIANDAQQFSRVIAASLIEHSPRDAARFVESIDFDADLLDAYLENRTALERVYSRALRRERRLIERLGANGKPRRESGRGRTALREYREFLEAPGSVHGTENGVAPAPDFEAAQDLLSARSIEACRADPTRRPYCLMTAYYANIYFGLRQAIEIDSLRAAIDAIDAGAPFAAEKRNHYLSALIHTASICTSGTSHFAQPRHLKKSSELVAMARRRRQDIVETFLDFSARIGEAVASTTFREGNRALGEDYRDLLVDGRDGPVFREDVRADLVYVDPPYTADNYSRFYHVLEVLATYGYPELARRDGAILRGRYPVIGERFLSGFCSAKTVAREFELVIRAAAASGSKLVISYGAPNGLLLKTWRREDPSTDPVTRLESLCRESFRRVDLRRRRLMHSGQGDSNIATDELIVVCRG